MTDIPLPNAVWRPSEKLPSDKESNPNKEQAALDIELESRSAKDDEVKDEFLVNWDGPDDPDFPQNWPARKRWANVLPLSAITLLSPLASSMFAPGLAQVLAAFHSSSRMIGSFTVSIYVLGFAFGPLLIAPLSEIYGRAICYHVSNVVGIVFTILCAESQSLGMLIAMRFLAGVAGSAPLTIGGGTISDMFKPHERGKAMSVWSLGPLLGPIVGPVCGGFLAQAKGWRWVFYVLAIAQGSAIIYCFFALKETYYPVLLARRAAKLRQSSGDPRYTTKEEREQSRASKVFAHAITRPLKMLCLNPVVFALSCHMAVTYSYLYLMFTTFPLVFEGHYGFTAGTSGLAYIGMGLGMGVGLAAFAAFSDGIVARRVAQTGQARPEDRLPWMVVGQYTTPVGLLWYGWSAAEHTHWIVPIIGTSLIGVGMISTFFPTNAFLMDLFGQYSASALAAVTVFRSLSGALVPLAGPPMYARLGVGWGNTTLALIAVGLSWVPFWLLFAGERVRRRFATPV